MINPEDFENNFQRFIVKEKSKRDELVWRSCPYCGEHVWDDPRKPAAAGFGIHVTALSHQGNSEWENDMKRWKDWLETKKSLR
jgi:hypothetical protein